jgi:N-acetylglucosaminyl-diphospho-decaprenol L-rhamnosyltransferase
VPGDATVVIVSYNTGALLAQCLDSLEDERGALDQRVIVIDNASNDDSVARVRERPGVELLEAGENLGFARAVNRAAADVDTEFLVLLNPDTVVLDRAIERLVAFAVANPGHGIYGGRTVGRDGSLQWASCWGLPTAWSLACFAFGLSTARRGSPLFDPESLGRWQRDSVREVGLVTGALLLVPTAVWRELGGFNERYFMYGEDADLAFRARAAGYRPVVTPEACIVHDGGAASATRGDKLLLLFQGKATLTRDHFSGWRRPFGLAALVTGVGLRTALGRAGPASRRPQAQGWRQVWRARRDWIAGYPPTTRTLEEQR